MKFKLNDTSLPAAFTKLGSPLSGSRAITVTDGPPKIDVSVIYHLTLRYFFIYQLLTAKNSQYQLFA